MSKAVSEIQQFGTNTSRIPILDKYNVVSCQYAINIKVQPVNTNIQDSHQRITQKFPQMCLN